VRDQVVQSRRLFGADPLQVALHRIGALLDGSNRRRTGILERFDSGSGGPLDNGEPAEKRLEHLGVSR
jgi:hypothetical protein